MVKESAFSKITRVMYEQNVSWQVALVVVSQRDKLDAKLRDRAAKKTK